MKIHSISNNYIHQNSYNHQNFSGLNGNFMNDYFEKCQNDEIDYLKHKIANSTAIQSSVKELIKTYQNCIKIYTERTYMQKLPIKVDFINADSIEEAKLFAKKVLGIDNLDINNLHIANYLNQELVNINNLANGKFYMPNCISFSTLENNIGGEYNKCYNLISFDSKDFTDYADIKQKQIDAKKYKNFGNSYEEYIKALLKAEKLTIDIIKPYIYHEIGHCFHRQILSSKYLDEEIKFYNDNLHKYELEYDFRKQITNLFQKNLDNVLKYPQQSIFQKLKAFLTSYGHKSLMKQLNELCEAHVHNMPIVKDISPIEKVLAEVSFSKEVAKSISEYAATKPSEFVAETFSKICLEGLSSISPKVLEMYKAFHGPILENFK